MRHLRGLSVSNKQLDIWHWRVLLKCAQTSLVRLKQNSNIGTSCIHAFYAVKYVSKRNCRENCLFRDWLSVLIRENLLFHYITILHWVLYTRFIFRRLASCTTGTASFLGVKRPGRGVDHPLQSSAEVKKRLRAVPLLPVCAFMACYRVNCKYQL